MDAPAPAGHAHQTPAWAVLLVLATTLFTATAQGIWKTGIGRFPAMDGLLLILAGFIVYGIAWVGLMVALRHGELSVLYPCIALSFVWVTLISWQVFGETISALKVAGIIGIIAGISLIGRGSHAPPTPEAVPPG